MGKCGTTEESKETHIDKTKKTKLAKYREEQSNGKQKSQKTK
jgi:hypothetical protein